MLTCATLPDRTRPHPILSYPILSHPWNCGRPNIRPVFTSSILKNGPLGAWSKHKQGFWDSRPSIWNFAHRSYESWPADRRAWLREVGMQKMNQCMHAWMTDWLTDGPTDQLLRGTKGVPRQGFEHRSTWGFEHVKNREENTIEPVVTYDPHSLGPP